MIQIQDTRFVYNWLKRGREYPRYRHLLPEFSDQFQRFERFVAEASLGDLVLNQWEVTYVNHVPTGDLWQKPEEWAGIVRNLWVPTVPDGSVDGINSEWQLRLNDNDGRLRISIQHARKQPSGPEILRVSLTARGPLDSREEIKPALDRGHEAIVRGFTAITTEQAHKHWRRRK